MVLVPAMVALSICRGRRFVHHIHVARAPSAITDWNVCLIFHAFPVGSVKIAPSCPSHGKVFGKWATCFVFERFALTCRSPILIMLIHLTIICQSIDEARRDLLGWVWLYPRNARMGSTSYQNGSPRRARRSASGSRGDDWIICTYRSSPGPARVSADRRGCSDAD